MQSCLTDLPQTISSSVRIAEHAAEHPDAIHWREAAKALGSRFDELMVARHDAHGLYRPIQDREAKGAVRRVSRRPNLVRHFRAKDVGDITVLYTLSLHSSCKWLGLDFDRHEGSPDLSQANFAAALEVYEQLQFHGCDPLLLDSDGNGGFHVLTYFDSWVPAERVYRAARWLIRAWQAFGLEKEPESFPRQQRLQPRGYGNGMRVPGRHHTHCHWSRAWNGQRWLDGRETVQHLLKTRRTPFSSLPTEAVTFESRPTRRSAVVPDQIAPEPNGTASNRLELMLPANAPQQDADADIHDLPVELFNAARGAAVRERRTRNRKQLELARRILATRYAGRAPNDRLYRLTFEVWYKASRPMMEMGRDQCWSEFQRNLQCARVPWGSGGDGSLEQQWDYVRKMPKDLLPQVGPRVREQSRRLAALCDLRGANGCEFGLPQQALAPIIGITQPALSQQIGKLLEAGHIVRTNQWRRRSETHPGEYQKYRLCRFAADRFPYVDETRAIVPMVLPTKRTPLSNP